MAPEWLLLASLLFTLMGVALGVVTGLVPGLHVNNVAVLIIVIQGSLFSLTVSMFALLSPTVTDVSVLVSCLIVGVVISHTFLDFIPSVYLGAPEPETALSVLPGHRMLLRGEGYLAIKLAAYASFWALLLSLAFLLPVRLLMGSPLFGYERIQPFIVLVLGGICLLMIWSERERVVGTAGVRLQVAYPEGIASPPGLPGQGLRTRSVREALERKGEAVLVEGTLHHEAGGWTLSDDTASIPIKFLGGEPEE